MPLKAGQVLERRYRIDGLLGQGGMGAVYQATDLRFRTCVAIKENLEVTDDSQRQFGREASLLHTLRHPALPRVTDYFAIPDQGQYLVMDFVEGEDLKAYLVRQGGLSEAQALAWIEQVLDALEYLHARDVIHRDVKPANVKITPQGQVFLVDFGLAKLYDPEQHTTIGARGVTPGYAPPEQYGQGRTDARSDVYSAGATLFCMLTGVVPPDSLELVIRRSALPSVRQLAPNVSPHVEAAVQRAMQVAPDDRFQSARELREALRAEPSTRMVGAARPQSPSAAERRRQQVASLYARGLAAFQREEWTEAEARCREALALDAGHTEARELCAKAGRARELSEKYARAVQAMQTRDWETVTVSLDQVLAEDSSYREARAYRQQAQAELDRQRQQRAAEPDERVSPAPPAVEHPRASRLPDLVSKAKALVGRWTRGIDWQSPRYLVGAILVVLAAITVGLVALFSSPGGGDEPVAAVAPVAPSEILYYTSDRDGQREVYRLRDGQEERLTQTVGGESWAPCWSETGILFTSDREGRTDLYRLREGQVERLTHTVSGESWAPVWSETGILFTSTRDGLRELYRLREGNVERLTHTIDGESWGPVHSEHGILFTSTRDGHRELYRLREGQVERLTHTLGGESWSPSWSETGILFTSNRSGKREVYRLYEGRAVQVTQTPGRAESWSPVATDEGIVFTSDRGGKPEAYLLHQGETERLTHTPGSGQSWTGEE
jgi:hypothetical protein